MTPLALDALFSMVAAGGSVLVACLRGWTRTARRRRRQREQRARDAARWESRTRYPRSGPHRGLAVVDVVRVARWGHCEEVVDTDGPVVTVAAGDDDKRVEAQTAAWLRAAELNGLS